MAYFRCIGDGGTPTPPTSEPYLYNNNQVYFNTGHIHTANTKVRIKGLFNWCNNYMQIFGARAGSFNSNAFGFFSSFASSRACFYRTGQEQTGSFFDAAASDTTTMFYMEPTIIECAGKTASWYRESDPLTVHSITAQYGNENTGLAPLALFGCNGSNQSQGWDPVDGAIMRFYWAEIYEDNELVQKFVPAYNNGQYCLYDEVNQAYFYEAAGHHTYLHGSPDIPTT